MDALTDRMGDVKVFTKLEETCGYWKIPMVSKEKYKTSFTTHMGTYRDKIWTFGLWNAPYAFQRYMENVLSGARWKRCLSYLNYVPILSKKIEEIVDHVEEVLSLLGAVGVFLKFGKVSIFRDRLGYLGFDDLTRNLAAPNLDTKALRIVTFPKNKMKQN